MMRCRCKSVKGQPKKKYHIINYFGFSPLGRKTKAKKGREALRFSSRALNKGLPKIQTLSVLSHAEKCECR